MRSLSLRSGSVLVALLAAAPPAPAQTAMSTQEIAAASRAATVQIRALDSRGAPLGTGSGFFVSPGGLIVTNFHVVEDAERLEVTTMDGETYDNVFFVTADGRRDLAVLRIPVEGVISLRLAAGTMADIGARVYAVGNPLGQTGTFTDGLVSAHRTIEGVQMLQISAPISEGSSGGAVLDATGEVIGVATMVMRGGQNLNYAVPVHYVRPLLSTGEAPQRFARGVLPPATGGLARVGSPQPAAPSTRTAAANPRRAPPIPTGTNLTRGVLEIMEAADDIVLREMGMVRRHEVMSGTLREGLSTSFTVQLERGRVYGILAVCDHDCDDVDLFVSTPAGREIARDIDVDDVPVVQFTAPVSGRYTVRVRMYSCSIEPCAWAAGTYQAP